MGDTHTPQLIPCPPFLATKCSIPPTVKSLCKYAVARGRENYSYPASVITWVVLSFFKNFAQCGMPAPVHAKDDIYNTRVFLLLHEFQLSVCKKESSFCHVHRSDPADGYVSLELLITCGK